MNPRRKILIVDDHAVVVEGIKAALDGHSRFEVVGEAFSGLDAVEQVASLKPDIVIMDISLPDLNGIDATRKIKTFSPGIRIIVFTMHSQKQYVVDFFKAGISAYVLKEDPVSDLIEAIHTASNGGTYFSRRTSAILVDYIQQLEEGKSSESGFENLSCRELEVFCLLADGKPIKEIAAGLYISPKTVESHKYNIFAKLNAHTLTDLTKIAIKNKLIQI